MTRRLHRCLTCPQSGPDARNPFAVPRGLTRHADRICSLCRARGHTHRGGIVRLTLLVDVPDFTAPRRADLERGVDLTSFLAGWHGTDCGCPGCARDRIPGRYA